MAKASAAGKAKGKPLKGVKGGKATPPEPSQSRKAKGGKPLKGVKADASRSPATPAGWRGRFWPFRRGTPSPEPVPGAPPSAAEALAPKVHRHAVLIEVHDDHL